MKNNKVDVKIMYYNKGMEQIPISKILHEVEHTVPSFFKNQETPRVLFTRTKSIRSSILNYRQTIDEIKTNDWKDHTYTCDCHNSQHCDKHHGHIVTGNLDLIKNKLLRELIEKGPT